MSLPYFLVFLRDLKQRILYYFTPNASKLVASLDKLEDKIERSVRKSTRELYNLKIAQDRLGDRIVQTNVDLDAVYKLLDKVSTVTR
jgi:hypothetical protein